MSNFHLQEIQSLQNSLREREKYATELENRLRALWDKYDGERKHYMDRIKRLEEAGDALERDKQALKRVLADLGVVGYMGLGSTVKWIQAKEAKP